MNQTLGARYRFEFGRHETFPVRHGWLSKGLSRIRETGNFQPNLETADALGLGSRMAKSLQFWLDATGLAEAGQKINRNGTVANKRQKVWYISKFGEAVFNDDPYLEYPATWWFVHMKLAQRDRSAWGWFFNDFHERNFSKDACMSAYRKHIKDNATNLASEAVTQRDITCLLHTYAIQSGNNVVDPEDGSICPLRDLKLIVRYSDVDRFEKARPLDNVPVEAFLACVADLARKLESDSVSFSQILRMRKGPARIFNLGGDQIESIAESASEKYHELGVNTTLLAAERHLILPNISTSEWFAKHFQRINNNLQ